MRQSDLKDISVFYPSYAGGKFISNCLTLSKHVALNPKKNVKNTDIEFLISEDYNFKLNYILSTLPKKSLMNQWLNYEVEEYTRDCEIYKKINSMGYRVCFMPHTYDEILNNCHIINLKRFHKFQSIAYELKKTNRPMPSEFLEERYNTIKGTDWPNFKDFANLGFDTRQLNVNKKIKNEIEKYYPISTYNNVYHFDMECIFDKNNFLFEIEKLYTFLQLDDFNKDLTCVYYQNYARLHNIEV